MSQVENCARRQHRAIDLLADIATLRAGIRRPRDRRKRELAKTTFDDQHFVNKGEERLVNAVEIGILPLNMAIEIAKSDDDDVQRALTQPILKRN